MINIFLPYLHMMNSVCCCYFQVVVVSVNPEYVDDLMSLIGAIPHSYSQGNVLLLGLWSSSENKSVVCV